jgi:hypothetical protein
VSDPVLALQREQGTHATTCRKCDQDTISRWDMQRNLTSLLEIGVSGHDDPHLLIDNGPLELPHLRRVDIELARLSSSLAR